MKEKSYVVKGYITATVEVFNATDEEDARQKGAELIEDLIACSGHSASNYDFHTAEVDHINEY